MAARRVPTLSQDQLIEVLSLIKGADTVELKLSVPDTDQRSVVASLGMDPLDVEIRQVAFYDTPGLTLNNHGLVVRARRVQRKPGDTVVKLRPVVPSELSAELRKSPAFGVEVDAMPGGFVCSASMKGVADPDEVKATFAGQRPLRKLFTKEQRAFYAANAPDGIGLEDLSMLGPINVMKLKFTPKDFGRKLVAELWTYPDGARILELSTKCAPSEAFDVAAQARAYLTSKGVSLSSTQQTKTRTALQYFAGLLESNKGPGR